MQKFSLNLWFVEKCLDLFMKQTPALDTGHQFLSPTVSKYDKDKF